MFLILHFTPQNINDTMMIIKCTLSLEINLPDRSIVHIFYTLERGKKRDHAPTPTGAHRGAAAARTVGASEAGVGGKRRNCKCCQGAQTLVKFFFIGRVSFISDSDWHFKFFKSWWCCPRLRETYQISFTPTILSCRLNCARAGGEWRTWWRSGTPSSTPSTTSSRSCSGRTSNKILNICILCYLPTVWLNRHGNFFL